MAESDAPTTMSLFNTMPHAVTLYINGPNVTAHVTIPAAAPVHQLVRGEFYSAADAPGACFHSSILVPITPPPQWIDEWKSAPPPGGPEFEDCAAVLVTPMIGRAAMEDPQMRGRIWGKPAVSPNTGPEYAVRGPDGRIIGSTALIFWSWGQ